MCLDFGGSNQIQLKSYEENRVIARVKIYILSTQLLQTQKLRSLYFRWWYWPWSFEEITQIRNSWSWRIPRGLVRFYSLNFRLQLLKPYYILSSKIYDTFVYLFELIWHLTQLNIHCHTFVLINYSHLSFAEQKRVVRCYKYSLTLFPLGFVTLYTVITGVIA